MNENVEERTPSLPVDLSELGSRLLDEARDADSGRAAVTLTPSDGGVLKQTLIAVRAGEEVGPEHWNGPASIQVLQGKATLTDGDDPLPAGSWNVIGEDVSINADDDLVALLTVSPRA